MYLEPEECVLFLLVSTRDGTKFMHSSFIIKVKAAEIVTSGKHVPLEETNSHI